LRRRGAGTQSLFRVYSEAEFLRLLERPLGELADRAAMRGGLAAASPSRGRTTVTITAASRYLRIVTGAAVATASAGAIAVLVISSEQQALRTRATADAGIGGPFSRAALSRSRSGPQQRRDESQRAVSRRAIVLAPPVRRPSQKRGPRQHELAPRRVQPSAHASGAAATPSRTDIPASSTSSSARVGAVARHDFTFER
jgi:hypothetical protein